MNRKQIIVILGLLIAFSAALKAQNKPLNLPNFTKSKYHWGFWLGYTQSAIIPTRKPNYTFSDSLISMTPNSIGSFSVGPIGSVSLHKNIKFRTAILLSFQDRNMDYVFWINDTTETFQKKLRSVYLEFPLQFKFVTDRINNIAFYGTLGGKYGYDFSSNITVKDDFDYDDVLKLKRHNIAWSLGGGVDFFLAYFKFGIDLRIDFGINNVLEQTDNFYSSPLDKIRTRMWQLSFTFEG
ncbi:MAG: porin family protein [Flavobacteriales bacterium]